MDKSQTVRVIDVALLGPVMVGLGARKSTLPTWARVFLVVTGTLTFSYNLRNYLAKRDAPRKPPAPAPPPLVRDALQRAANKAGVPLRVLTAVAYTESRFNPSVTSPAGAQGLMQLMPVIVERYGVTDPYNAYQSALGGARLLRRLHDRFGKWSPTLAAYNWGIGNVTRTPSPQDWPPQTVRYVANVLRVSKA